MSDLFEVKNNKIQLAREITSNDIEASLNVTDKGLEYSENLKQEYLLELFEKTGGYDPHSGVNPKVAEQFRDIASVSAGVIVPADNTTLIVSNHQKNASAIINNILNEQNEMGREWKEKIAFNMNTTVDTQLHIANTYGNLELKQGAPEYTEEVSMGFKSNSVLGAFSASRDADLAKQVESVKEVEFGMSR